MLNLTLNVVPVRTEDWEWSIGYNMSINDNEITILPFEQQTGGISAGTGNIVQFRENVKHHIVLLFIKQFLTHLFRQ